MLIEVRVSAEYRIDNKSPETALHNQTLLGLEGYLRIGSSLQHSIDGAHLVLVRQQSVENQVLCGLRWQPCGPQRLRNIGDMHGNIPAGFGALHVGRFFDDATLDSLEALKLENARIIQWKIFFDIPRRCPDWRYAFWYLLNGKLKLDNIIEQHTYTKRQFGKHFWKPIIIQKKGRKMGKINIGEKNHCRKPFDHKISPLKTLETRILTLLAYSIF